VTVWDGTSRPPAPPAHVPADAVSGRGLFLVGFLSERWGWYEPQDKSGGKYVWCEVTSESAARGM
jgi:hypothetical protein